VTECIFRLDILLEISLGSSIGQLRAMPVRLGEGAPKAFLAVYCADFDDDPYIEMFFFPTDTLKIRNSIFGGYANGEPVLVTAQGTYGDMFLQGWRPDMNLRWEHRIGKDDPGARGSHMCAIADMDQDGVQEVLWGERCIELSAGRECFCADRDTYRGHSDVAQPILDCENEQWFV
jgi:hypothetical protein